MTCAVALVLVCSLLWHQCNGFNFDGLPKNLLPSAKELDKKTTDIEVSNMMKTFEHKMSKMSDDMQKMNASLIKFQMEPLDKLTRMVEEMKSRTDSTDERFAPMKEELTKTVGRLQKQCMWTDRRNAALQSAVKFDGYPMLAFKEAFTSSLYYYEGKPMKADNAIDGNLNSNFKAGSCTHTLNDDPSPWWLGILQIESEIHRLELRDRTDCCSGRLNHISVQVYQTDPRTDVDAQPGLCGKIQQTKSTIINVTCDTPLTGKYIRIFKNMKQVFHLCEVRAFGFVGQSQRFGTATQNSDVADAKLAIDGDPKTCSETRDENGSDIWWQVDLLGKTNLTGLTLTNRDDEKYTYLSNFEVIVSQNAPSVCGSPTRDVCTSFKGTVGQGEYVTLTCDKPMTGRFLRIRKLDGYDGPLSLCDVRLKKYSLED